MKKLSQLILWQYSRHNSLPKTLGKCINSLYSIGMAIWLNIISKTPSLVFLFILQLILGASFYIVQNNVGGALLDLEMSGENARKILSHMNEVQIHYHLLATATLDMIYPFAYSGFFAGFSWRMTNFLGFNIKWRALLIVPTLCALLADLCENTVQLIALNGNASYLNLKDIVTPLKYGSFLFALFIVVVLTILALSKKLKKEA